LFFRGSFLVRRSAGRPRELGSPLVYTGDRQDDAIAALAHVRGVLYNYYTPSDTAIRYMAGGLLYEPRGWPDKDLPKSVRMK
jgi:hypothetical protein